MGRRRDRKGDAPVVEPLDVDGIRSLAVITVAWAVAFVVLAFQRAALDEADLGWLLWTCLAGVGLGLLGLEYCRKRRDAIAREELHEEADAELPDGPRDAEHVESVAAQEPVWDDGTHSEPYPAAAPLPERHPAAEPVEQFGYDAAEPSEQLRHDAAAEPGYGTAEEVQPMHHPDEQHQHREGRPPPGYVTGDLPVVPPQPPPRQAPGRPPAVEPDPAAQPWHDQPWPAAPEPPQGTPQPSQPGYAFDPASPAGYSPEPDRVRRHPRDIEIARRREAEAGQAYGEVGYASAPAPPEFLQDEPEPPGAAAPDLGAGLLGSDSDAGIAPGWAVSATGPVAEPQAGPEQQPADAPAEPDPVRESEFFSDLPAVGGVPDPAGQSEEEDPDVLLGDTPQTPGRRARRDSRRSSSGEYRGRRARRD